MTTNSLVSFEIKVDSKTMPSSALIQRLNIVLHSDQESMASFNVVENKANGTLLLPFDIQEGTELEISLGYDGKNDFVFKGTAAAVELQVNIEIGSTFIISAVADEEFTETEASVFTVTRGENMLGLDAVAHVEEGKHKGRYPSEVEVKTLGTSKVSPMNTITLAGCTDWFDGDYEVLTVRHNVEDGSWDTQFVVSA